MTISWQGLDAQPVLIEFGVVPPFGVDFVKQVSHSCVTVAGLALAEVAVETLLEGLNLFGPRAAVQFANPFLGSKEDPVIDIDSVYLDVTSNKLETLAPMLANKLMWVHPASLLGEPSSNLREERQDGFLIWCNDYGVIHEAGVKQPHFVDGPVVEVVKVVIHTILPDKSADAGADSGLHVEYGFVRWDELPFRLWRAPLAPR